jgi:MYXO-CTERM domain-containing protein
VSRCVGGAVQCLCSGDPDGDTDPIVVGGGDGGPDYGDGAGAPISIGGLDPMTGGCTCAAASGAEPAPLAAALALLALLAAAWRRCG